MKIRVLLCCLMLSLAIVLVACGGSNPPGDEESALRVFVPGPDLAKAVEMDPVILDQYPCPPSADETSEKPEPKVLVCHIPPGDPRSRKEICIAKAAIKAHVKDHGPNDVRDYLGSCF